MFKRLWRWIDRRFFTCNHKYLEMPTETIGETVCAMCGKVMREDFYDVRNKNRNG